MIPTVLAPSVPIELGGRMRHLKMDLCAMALIEEQTGINLINDVAAIQNPSPRMLMVLAWACLVADDPELEEPKAGLKRVGSWIDFSNAIPLLTALSDAFTLASPAPGTVTPNGTDPKNQRRASRS